MYWINEDSKVGSSKQVSFYADAESDINNLPTMTTKGVQQGNDTVSCEPVGCGSYCLVIGSGNVYMLNSENTWAVLGG